MDLAQPQAPPPETLLDRRPENLTAEMQEALDNCLECQRVCLQTIPHCLSLGGAHATRDHLELLINCAKICETAAQFMIWGSELHAQLCGVCAEVCRRCADDCARFPEDEMMQICAESCQTCAESCARMSQTH